MGTHDRNKKAGLPTTTGIPASKPADYKGNFGLDEELVGQFDVAASFGVCEHFTGARRLAAVRAHVDVLRPGGLIFICVPNRWAPVYRLWMARLRSQGKWAYGTEVPFSASELKRLALDAGAIPLAVTYGTLATSLFDQGINPLLGRMNRKPMRVPGFRLPLLDKGAYDVMLVAKRPATGS